MRWSSFLMFFDSWLLAEMTRPCFAAFFNAASDSGALAATCGKSVFVRTTTCGVRESVCE